MQNHSVRGRLALAAFVACASGPALAVGSYGTPRIQSVVVMDDLNAIAIVGESLPPRPAELRVTLGPTGEPGDITRFCRPTTPIGRAIVCTLAGGLPPAGDYLLKVDSTRQNTSVEYALTIGAVGATGPRGAQGERGATGAAGATGPTGPAGTTGPAGAPGAPGPIGPQGLPGNDGATGAIGPAGATGPMGPQGVQGATGAVGPIGPQGQQGDLGPVGPQGLAGAEGPVGPQGATGDIGPQGPQGPTGPAGRDGTNGVDGRNGVDGANGAAGAAGPEGQPGPQGPQGPVGPQGPAGTTAFGNAQYLATRTSGAYTATDCVIGEVIMTAGAITTRVPADGRLLQIQQYGALFAILGTTYGGDGQTNFAVPDLRSAAPVQINYGICADGVFPGSD